MTIVSIDEENIANAIKSDFSDFEDAVQYYAAFSANVDCIVTRNTKDYTMSEIPVYTPDTLLAK